MRHCIQIHAVSKSVNHLEKLFIDGLRRSLNLEFARRYLLILSGIRSHRNLILTEGRQLT